MRVYDDEVELPRVSATKIKTFLICPKKYEFRYVLDKEEKPNIYAVLGLSVHKAIADFYVSGSNPRTRFIEHWDALIQDYQLRDDVYLFRRGLNIIDRYPHYHDKPIEVEKEYFLPYPPDNPLCLLHVVYDQIYEWGIRDLKTNMKKPKPLDLSYDMQFILYAHAFEVLFNKKPKVVWHHLETGEDINVAIYADYGYTQEIIRALLDQNVFYRRVGDHCTFCSYRKECLGG